MPTFNSVADFKKAIAKMEADIIARQQAMGVKMAEKARAKAYEVARSDLGGDIKFSGWAPELELKVKPITGGAVLMPTRSSAGPWTVAELGRNRGSSGGFSGPGLNVRTGLTARTKSGGLRKVRARKAKRWNGYTDGKETASKANIRIDKAVSDIPERELKVVIRRHFD